MRPQANHQIPGDTVFPPIGERVKINTRPPPDRGHDGRAQVRASENIIRYFHFHFRRLCRADLIFRIFRGFFVSPCGLQHESSRVESRSIKWFLLFIQLVRLDHFSVSRNNHIVSESIRGAGGEGDCFFEHCTSLISNLTRIFNGDVRVHRSRRGIRTVPVQIQFPLRHIGKYVITSYTGRRYHFTHY